MKFARTPIAEAEGAILAHGVAAFKKGHVLTPADITALQRANVDAVMVARLEEGDVPENLAAERIARAAGGAQTTLSPAHTGRTNLYAGVRGLVLIDETRVNALNAIHESITIATLQPYELVEPRQMLATVKIIPFAAPAWAVSKAEDVALAQPSPSLSWSAQADHPRLTSSAQEEVVGGPPARTMTKEGASLIQVAAFRAKSIALVSTTIPTMKTPLLDKNRAVLAARAEALGSTISFETRCAHESNAIAAAIVKCTKQSPDMILIFGASATTDRADAVPAGILAAGGALDHFGMPVDPGNLLLLAHLGKTPVIGLPGCARSPKLNGFDWVLQRLCADVTVTPSDIMSMGVGGLLKEIPTRPQPRDLSPPKAQRAPVIAAIVLAAGSSTRMGTQNKLLLNLHGTPMVARTLSAITASAVKPVVVVTGNDAEAIRNALSGQTVDFAHNPRFADGMSTSLKAGLAALPADIDGVLICLADMPAVTTATIGTLIAAFNPTEGRAIVVPSFQGKRGNPVLFAKSFIDEMRATAGDIGARALLSAHAEAVYEVEIDDAGILADADTPAAFAAIEADFKT